MKKKIIILLVLVFIFAPFVSIAQEDMPEPAQDQNQDQQQEQVPEPIPEPAPDIANLTIFVRTDVDQNPPKIFRFHMEGYDAHSHYFQSADYDLPILDLKTSTESFDISTFDKPIYYLRQNKIPGIKLTDIFCTSDDIPMEFTRQSDTISFYPQKGAKIICNFNDVNVKVPVLIVPGLLGTELKNGDETLWADIGRMVNPLNSDNFMDPLEFNADLTPSNSSVSVDNVMGVKTLLGARVFDYTDGLIKEFEDQGYVQGTDENATLFLFPYDWRYGVSGKYPDGWTTNGELLREKVDEIFKQTGVQKIDIVAHSLGGLIVKDYIENHMYAYNDNGDLSNIRRAVFVGVPITGAPKAVKVLVQGDNFGILGLNDQEMEKIAENMPAAYDLLPSKKYFNEKSSFIKIVEKPDIFTSTQKFLTYDESKSFLTDEHNLNSTALANSENFHAQVLDNFDLRRMGIDLYAIDGCKAGTIGQIVEVKTKDILGGEHITFDSPELTPGDNTVPLESATDLPVEQGNKFYALVSDHGKMPSQDGIRQEILNIVNGDPYDMDSSLITQDIGKCNLNGRAISVFSPINIFATDQNGNRLGLADDGSIINEIPNADFEIFGEHKFVYLPTDSGQVYSINLTGTDTGTFTIKSEDIQNNQITKTEVFSDLAVTPDLTGTVNLNSADNSTTISVKQNSVENLETILPDGSQPAPEPPAPEPEPTPPTPEPEPIEKTDTTPPVAPVETASGGGANNYLLADVPVQAKQPEIASSPPAPRNDGASLPPVIPAIPVIPANAGVQIASSPPAPRNDVVKEKPAAKPAEIPKTIKPVKLAVKMVEQQPIGTAGISANPGILNYFKNWLSQLFYRLFKK